jgi:asparagine synthase (glutamine-hydrolysing)
MCGIAGIVCWAGPRNPSALAEPSRRLAHRGPDDAGALPWRPGARAVTSDDPRDLPPGNVLLAHRRLSILDLSDAAAQPMSDPAGRRHLIFNGEIYNYLELREELAAAGWRFSSTGDTETLLAALSLWGERALERLTGMFAAAFLDTDARSLLLVRDPFGIKPLYYARTAGGDLAFASEVPALLAAGEVDRGIDPQRLYEYLRFGISDYGERTLLTGVRQLPPGHLMRVPLDRGQGAGVPPLPAPVRYWRPEPDRPCELGFEAAAERLRETFLTNVRLHLRSDVPVGTALSGGADSSAIVCAIRRVAGPRRPIHAFSYIADDPALSEDTWVDLVGRRANLRVHKVSAEPGELVADLDDLIAAQGEPFSSTSMYVQYRVFRLAAEAGVKVMLDGQGADELLAGYRYYVGAAVTSLLRHGRPARAARLLASAMRLPGPGGGRWLLVYTGLYALPPRVGALARRMIGEDLTPNWLDGRWLADRGVRLESPRVSGRRDALREQLAETLTRTSLPKLLRYEDRSSMAFSIESRVPFLTADMARLCLSMPESYHVGPDGMGKRLFRRAMRGIVPDTILDRRDKIGFATPETAWLTALRPWMEQVLTSDRARTIPALRPERLAGSAWTDRCTWRIANLVRWAERFDVRFDV